MVAVMNLRKNLAKGKAQNSEGEWAQSNIILQPTC